MNVMTKFPGTSVRFIGSSPRKVFTYYEYEANLFIL